MSEREITHFEDVDVDKLKQSFNEWVDKFLDQFRNIPNVTQDSLGGEPMGIYPHGGLVQLHI